MAQAVTEGDTPPPAKIYDFGHLPLWGRLWVVPILFPPLPNGKNVVYYPEFTFSMEVSHEATAIFLEI